MRRFRTISLRLGTILLAVTFLGLGVSELIHPLGFGLADAAESGTPLALLLAGGEMVGGLLLLLPGVAWYGAVLLGVVLAGTLSSQFGQPEILPFVVSTVLLVGVVLLGYAHHPRTFALARLRAVADAVAEREMAQEQQRSSRAPVRPGFRATSASPRPTDRAAVAARFASRSSEA